MKPIRILVVEDDALLAISLEEMLIEMGHEICAVEGTEAAAVAAALQHAPDLIIVDAWLREGSGISAVEQILRARSIWHLFVSGDMRSVQQAIPGAVVLQKPFRESELASAIQRACDVKMAN